jgi:formamidopyrimidine-DNA glycosylase
MPELPEVETVKRGLATALTGATIQKVILRRGNLRTPFPDDFAEKLEGAKIKSVARRAKYLLFYLDNAEILIAHLGMTGRFSVLPAAPKEFAKHDHVAFILADGRCVIYNDARRFGVMDLCSEFTLLSHKFLAHLAPEPLEDGFSAEYLTDSLKKRATPIKPTIMEQKIVVGVGNIYANEALFMAGISPLTPANSEAITKKIPLLINCIHKVLQDAIAAGGSTLRDFAHVSGESGYFQHQFHVYGRKGLPCTKCGTPIIAMKQAGRATFYCEKCQKC